MLPAPSDKPFAFPDIAVDLTDSSIALESPFGPLGVAVEGAGNLSGGFRGRLAVASPRLTPGGCELVGMRAAVAVTIVTRRPRVVGPVSADRFTCPSSRIALVAPRLDLDSLFTEAFASFDGKARLFAQSVDMCPGAGRKQRLAGQQCAQVVHRGRAKCSGAAHAITSSALTPPAA